MSVKNLLFKFSDFFQKKSLISLTNSTTEFFQIALEELVEHWIVTELGGKIVEKKKISSMKKAMGLILG